jgi:hypothetical protein
MGAHFLDISSNIYNLSCGDRKKQESEERVRAKANPSRRKGQSF